MCAVLTEISKDNLYVTRVKWRATSHHVISPYHDTSYMYVFLMLFNAYKTFLLIWQKFYSRYVVTRPVTALQQFFSFICCYHHTAGENKHALCNSCDSYRCLRCCVSMEHECCCIWSQLLYTIRSAYGICSRTVNSPCLRCFSPGVKTL